MFGYPWSQTIRNGLFGPVFLLTTSEESFIFQQFVPSTRYFEVKAVMRNLPSGHRKQSKHLMHLDNHAYISLLLA